MSNNEAFNFLLKALSPPKNQSVTLTNFQINRLVKLCEKEIRKQRKQYEQGNFEPAPGKMNADLMRAKILEEIVTVLKVDDET